MVGDHMVLTPDGFDFAPYPMLVETDRDKFAIQRIVPPSSATNAPRPVRRDHHRRARALNELAQVLRKHRTPRGPLVRPLRSPVVDPVRDLFGAQRLGHPPGLADVLPLALARGQQNPAQTAAGPAAGPAGRAGTAAARRSTGPGSRPRRRSARSGTCRSSRSRP